jgi:lipopolysaccharide biosynthesis regulator YciM
MKEETTGNQETERNPTPMKCSKAFPNRLARVHEMVFKEALFVGRMQPASRVLTMMYECPNCGFTAVTRETAYPEPYPETGG